MIPFLSGSPRVASSAWYSSPPIRTWQRPTSVRARMTRRRAPGSRWTSLENHVPLVDIASKLRDQHFADELHPNDEGAQVIATEVFRVLSEVRRETASPSFPS